MQTAAAQHPSADDLAAFAVGRLTAEKFADVERHLLHCDACGRILSGVQDDTLVRLARAAATMSYTPAPETVAEDRPPSVPAELLDHPRYRVVGLLGRGGMGTVFRAEHRLMARHVALKVINPRLTADPKSIARFQRETRAAAQLVHPNIVTAYDAEQSGDLHFLVMEYIEGVSLDRLVARRGPLKPEQASSLIRQAALGLAHAHEKGMVHRDIKPQNLMVTLAGRVKILDFGLSRFAQEELIGADAYLVGSGKESSRTLAGSLLGTPDYIAPEQVSDPSNADIRADIYSLGCTFYFLLTGRPPFPNGSLTEKLEARRNASPPSVALLRPEISAKIIAVVDKMSAISPGDRFQTPAEVAQACAEALTKDVPASAPAAFKPRSMIARRAVMIGGFAAASALAAGAFWNGKNGAKLHRRVLFVVPPEGVWFPDYGPVKARLEAAGIEVRTASTSAGTCRVLPSADRAFPATIWADAAVGEIDVTEERFAAAVFVGYKIDPLISAPHRADVAKLISTLRRRGKIIAALCVGQAVLAQHELLDGKRAAGGEFLQREYPYAVPGGPNWTGKSVEVEDGGLLITGRDEQSAAEFVDELLRRINS